MIELVMHTEKNDTVFHTKKTGMLRLVVEIDVGGMTADAVDKVTCSFDDLQLEQVDQKYVHALNEPHLHDIFVVPNRHEVDQVFYVATNSELNVARFTEMHAANTIVEARCLELEAELSNLRDKSHHDNHEELVNRFFKLEVNHLNLQLKYQKLKDDFGNNPPTPDKDTPDFDSVFVIGKMQASLQGKDNVIRHLKKQISHLQEIRSDTDRTLKVRTADTQITQFFGALCYPINDNEDLGKLQPTADIGIFVGYAPSRKGFRIYNKRTRRIMETIHVQFDELTEPMAPVHLSIGPAPNILTHGHISSGLPMFDEYLEPHRVERPVSPTQAVQALVNLAGTPSSTTIDQDTPSSSISRSSSALQSHQGVAAKSITIEDNHIAPVENTPFTYVFAPKPSSDASSSGDISSTESTYVSQTLHHLNK
nr:retrovirus-related Pol polyprotein from transposon TNT 1-94 [Tanacetum cinerariifolium]